MTSKPLISNYGSKKEVEIYLLTNRVYKGIEELSLEIHI
jgi:hypothetical protein